MTIDNSNKMVIKWFEQNGLTLFNELNLSTLYIEPDGGSNNIYVSSLFQYILQIVFPKIFIVNEDEKSSKVKHDLIMQILTRRTLEFKTKQAQFSKWKQDIKFDWDKRWSNNKCGQSADIPDYTLLYLRSSVTKNNPGFLGLLDMNTVRLKASRHKNAITVKKNQFIWQLQSQATSMPVLDNNQLSLHTFMSHVNDTILYTVTQKHKICKQCIVDYVNIEQPIPYKRRTKSKKRTPIAKPGRMTPEQANELIKSL